MKVEEKIVLKGQNILAQGKRRRSVALGLSANKRIVRAIALIKEQFLFRTKKMSFILAEMGKSCPSEMSFFASIIMVPRTVWSVFPIPRALLWAELYWPFMPKKGKHQNSFSF
jgi:hypothetical protein